ncbi:MAG: hypothetical protein SGILL_006094, partial [Bacillariaceae sp.]
GRWHRKYSDMGNTLVGVANVSGSLPLLPEHLSEELPPFSSLSWIDRQLVREWRTYLPEQQDNVSAGASPGAGAGSISSTTIYEEDNDNDNDNDEDHGDDLDDFEHARTLVPNIIPRPTWQKSDVCFECHQPFGPTRLRHHCRSCGCSFCHAHSTSTQRLPHLGYEDIPERVCDACKRTLEEQNLAERVAWRLARCRDYSNQSLTPYFETGLDSVEEVAIRVTKAALAMAKSIPLGAQATVAVETVDVLRKYGLHGIYGIMLRQEFLAAADLLRKALGINKTSWPLSVHELSAAIFYALAQHRAMRGLNPEREHTIHQFRPSDALPTTILVYELSALDFRSTPVIDQTDVYNPDFSSTVQPVSGPTSNLCDPRQPKIKIVEEVPTTPEPTTFTPVCDPVSDAVIASLVFYAPIALNFVYAEKEVEMQLLAAQQGWRLLYAYLTQDLENITDRPASALFIHQEHKIACLSIRGTATINDVITDIRQVPVPFPDIDSDLGLESNDGDWTNVFHGQGLKENIGSTLEETALLKAYAYGTPSCVDASLAGSVNSFVTTVVLHDDVFPRLTPTSCRGLLKHLLHIRETWVKTHMEDDLRAVGERAKTAWAPRFRHSFALRSSSTSSIKKYCKKQIQNGKKTLRSVKDKAIGRPPTERMNANLTDPTLQNSESAIDAVVEAESIVSPNPSEWGEKFFVPATEVSVSDSFDSAREESEATEDDVNGQTPLVLEIIGSGDPRNDGLVIDGDEFFEPEESLLEGSDEDTEVSDADLYGDPQWEQEEQSPTRSDSWSLEMHGGDPSPVKKKSSSLDGKEEDVVAAIVVEETPLPRMFVPGKVIHLYSHRGVYKAAYVPRTFRELRRISLAGNMLSNHTTKSYYEGLLE